ncbi:hypothetical protein HID58_022997 [Brassica napus]|uniref:Uncharacterized protein n=1 Tax=Brassica napus TaxID=3708 RepID=A0ABQ8D0T8_BRANA|nr:hypothetical protein HID58_022997 [Brassica napus]
MLLFCLRLWRYVLPEWKHVIERFLLVIHYVYSRDIKTKNGVYQNADGKLAKWKLIRTTWTECVC